MKFEVIDIDVKARKTDVLLFFVFSGQEKLEENAFSIDSELNNEISAMRSVSVSYLRLRWGKPRTAPQQSDDVPWPILRPDGHLSGPLPVSVGVIPGIAGTGQVVVMFGHVIAGARPRLRSPL